MGLALVGEGSRGKFPGTRSGVDGQYSIQQLGRLEKALDAFRHGEIDILLGTQMIAKALTFRT